MYIETGICNRLCLIIQVFHTSQAVLILQTLIPRLTSPSNQPSADGSDLVALVGMGLSLLSFYVLSRSIAFKYA